MNKQLSSGWLVGMAVTTLGANLGPVAFAAETAATANGDELTEIIVTARRTEENLQDVPISIAVFNQQQLENRNVVSAGDLATYVPSLSVNSNYGNDNTAFALRGFTQDTGTAPSVGVFFADVIAPRAASNGLPGGDGAGPGSFFDLENVQILKGPQGTLFGRNTTGGDILLVPKKPTSELSGYIEGGVGNYDDGEVQAVVNIPINDSFRVRAGVVHETREGYLHSNSGVGPKDFDDVDFTAARLSAVIDILPNLENYTIASFSKTDDNGGVGKLVGADPSIVTGSILDGPSAARQLSSQQGSGFYDVQQPFDNPESRLQQWQVINTTTWKATDHLTVKNIGSYAQLRDYYNDPIFGTFFYTPTNGALPYNSPPYTTAAAPGLPWNFAGSNPLPGSNTAQEKTITEELQVQGDALDQRLTYQGGAYFELELPQQYVGALSPVLAHCPTYANVLNCTGTLDTALANELVAFGQVPAGTPFIPAGSVNETIGRTKYRDYAFYFQDTYKIIDQLKVTTGIRWTRDHEEIDDVQETYAYLPYPGLGLLPTIPGVTPKCSAGGTLPSCLTHPELTSQAPTWLVDFDYTPLDNLLLYAKYTRGYREGTINPTAPLGFNLVQPEKVDTYELGEKFAFHGPVTGTVNAAVFYNDFRNQQIQLGFNGNQLSPTGPGNPFAAPENAGKSRIYGAELDSSIKLFAGARLDLGYTYLNTRIQAVTTPTLPATSPYVVSGAFKVGDQLVLSPRNKASITPSYTLPLPDTIGAVTLAATYTYTGKQLTNYSDRDEAPLAQFSYLAATKLLNLNLNWNNIMGKPVDLSVFATNVTKVDYYTFCAGLGGFAGSSQGFETCAVGAPMMLGARVKIRYH
jgi:iron complex outermembrane recepter protein